MKRLYTWTIPVDLLAESALASASTGPQDLDVDFGKRCRIGAAPTDDPGAMAAALRRYLLRGSYVDRSGVADSAQGDPVAPAEPHDGSSYRAVCASFRGLGLIGECAGAACSAPLAGGAATGEDEVMYTTGDVRPAAELPSFSCSPFVSALESGQLATTMLPSMISGTYGVR
mmetsp:Transcript_139201/g.444176  ORF Transcript_139201/g.444176 Transcript_139201/m.444176 type:complete len:172 (+) Transcript_139201:102-617(+)